MSVGTAHISQAKIGTCPHGAPQGACPICNGMAGGNSTTKRDIPRNIGEMTYNQCAAIGAMLKAQKAAKKRAELAEQSRLQSIADFTKNLALLKENISIMTVKISNTFPAFVSRPVNFILNQIVGRFINITVNIISFVSNIVGHFIDISDKLSAMYGEAKSAIQKTASEIWNKFRKKMKSIFFVFGAVDVENEEYKIDEAKKAFNLKTFIHSLAQKLKERKPDEH